MHLSKHEVIAVRVHEYGAATGLPDSYQYFAAFYCSTDPRKRSMGLKRGGKS